MLRRLTLMALLAVFVLAGCQRDEEADGQSAADEGRAEAMFRHVPADTPYLFANLQPSPDAVVDTTFRAMEEMGKSLEAMFRMALSEADSDLEREKIRAVLDEVRGLMTREGFANAGFRENGLYVVYAQGLLPVMRWEVADPMAVAETVGRFETALEMSFPRREHDGQEYWWVGLGDKAGIVAAVVDNELVAGLTTGEEAEVASILGDSAPSSSYAVSDFRTFNEDLGFTPHGSGFIQFAPLVDRLMDAEDPQFGWLHEENPQFAAIAGNEACRAELGALFDVVPRMVSGAREVSAERIHSMARLDIREDYATRLKSVVDTPLDLSDDPGSLMNFGMAINIVNLRDFLRAEADRLVENAPECPLFAGLNENISEMQANMNRPIPPVVTNLHGFKLRLATAEVTDGELGNVTASFALAMRNPQLLLGMAQMFAPQLAELNVTPGGDPQPLPAEMIPPMAGGMLPTDQLYIAMSDGALGIAMGDSERDRLSDYLDISGAGGGGFLSYAMDTRAYADLMKAAGKAYGEQVMDNADDGMSADDQGDMSGTEGADDGMDAEGDAEGDATGDETGTAEPDMAELFENQPSMVFMSHLYSRYFGTIRFTDQGMEFVQDAELRQAD